MTQLFPVITAEMLSKAVAQRRAVGAYEGNVILQQIRAALAKQNLQRGGHTSGSLGVPSSVVSGRPAAS